MNKKYAIINDDRGNMIGNATKEPHGNYYNGRIGSTSFQCPGDLLAEWVLGKTGHRARVVYVSEPLWLMGIVISL